MTGATATSAGPRTLVGQALLQSDPAGLRALALRSRNDLVVDALRRRAAGSDVASRLSLAAALAGMGRSGEELAEAVEIYEQVLAGHGAKVIPSVDQRHLVQAAFLAGRHDLVEHALQVLPRLTDAVVSGLRADLANQVVGGPGARSQAEWEALFGARFVDRGLAAPTVSTEGACLFDGLGSGQARRVGGQAPGSGQARGVVGQARGVGGSPPGLAGQGSVDGPLVTVIVPAYRPEEGLVTSVRSILAQSYANLEVLLVDDCSGPGYAEVLERAEALDPRVRLLRQERNGGSYLARNAALAQARGELVTTQDADDWSHPERLARQVALMTQSPGSVASRSAAIRCRPDLTRQWFGYSPERMNASSLMVRREVLERLGGFDQIRKGADSEMIERLGLLGEGALVDVTLPLAVTRLAEGSLSRADFSLGRHSADRVLFRSAFRWWHLQVAGRSGSRADAGLGEEPVADSGSRARAADVDGLTLRREGSRPFPVPRSFVRDLPGQGPGRTTYDLVVLTDLARPLPDVVRRLPDVARPVRLEDSGHTPTDRVETPTTVTRAQPGRVAVLGREDLARGAVDVPTWDDSLVEAGRDGQVDLLTDAVPVHAETLVVTDASLLALPALPLPELTAERVLVVAIPPGPGEPPRDLEEAGRVVREWLGRAPVWVVPGEAERTVWQQEGWDLPLLGDALGSPPCAR